MTFHRLPITTEQEQQIAEAVGQAIDRIAGQPLAFVLTVGLLEKPADWKPGDTAEQSNIEGCEPLHANVLWRAALAASNARFRPKLVPVEFPEEPNQ